MIIGIDHGYGYMKTANACFLTGVSEFAVEPPLKKRVISLEQEAI